MTSFFQSDVFGEFQKRLPERGKIWKLIADNKQQAAAGSREFDLTCLVIKQKLPLKKCWLWAPYGPAGYNKKIFYDLEKIAKAENAVFARIEPPLNWETKFTDEIQKKWRVVSAKNRYTPEYTLVINVSASKENILGQMKQKARYNIKIAEREGVTCKIYQRPSGDEIDVFYSLLKKTGERDEFGIHTKNFYQNFLETFGRKNMSCLIIAYNKTKQPVAGIIVVFYKDTATYCYGASDYQHRSLMAPYLLQWQAIKETQRRGLKYYDFLGVAPPETVNHRWRGITEFKKKFGGYTIKYPAAFDIVYQPLWYKGFCLAKKLWGR